MITLKKTDEKYEVKLLYATNRLGDKYDDWRTEYYGLNGVVMIYKSKFNSTMSIFYVDDPIKIKYLKTSFIRSIEPDIKLNRLRIYTENSIYVFELSSVSEKSMESIEDWSYNTLRIIE